MHYRNGREAKNGDTIVQLNGGKIEAFGVTCGNTPGNDYCNGMLLVKQTNPLCACLVDCLHIEDIEKMIAEKGFG